MMPTPGLTSTDCVKLLHKDTSQLKIIEGAHQDTQPCALEYVAQLKEKSTVTKFDFQTYRQTAALETGTF